MNKQIDTGAIIYNQKTPIHPDETAGDLHDRLMNMGALLVLKTVKAIESGMVKAEVQQIEGDLKEAPKLFKSDCIIDWNQPLHTVYNKVRGLSPYPTAYTLLNGQILKIFSAVPELKTDNELLTGTYQTDGKTYLRFRASDGYLSLTEVQLENKKKMCIADFLKGFRI